MENNSGIRNIFTLSWVYELFQRSLGSMYSWNWLAKHVLKVEKGFKVVDVGCGPGTSLRHIPDDIEYYGFDPSEDYIARAKANYSDRGEFVCGNMEQFISERPELRGKVDLVLTNGVLHHVDDATAMSILKCSHELLSPGGRFVALEPTFLRHHSLLSKWIIGQDRGQGVRQEKEWKRLLSEVFAEFETSVVTGLIRLPYTHIILEGWK